MIGILFRINQIQRKLADIKISQTDSLFAEAGDVWEELVENLRQEGEVARHAVAQPQCLRPSTALCCYREWLEGSKSFILLDFETILK